MKIRVESKIVNTVMENYDNKVYFVTPNSGYTLHHNSYDFQDLGTNEVDYGFSTSGVSVPIDYDFEENADNIFTILVDAVDSYKSNRKEKASEQDYQEALIEFGVSLDE